jgi:transcription initiation factor TFIID subunit 7
MSAPSPGGDASAAPAPPPKPRLKINVSRTSSFIGEVGTTPGGAHSSTNAPLATPGEGPRKLKLKISSSQPPTPAAASATKDVVMKDVGKEKEIKKDKEKDKDKDKDKNKGLPPVVTTKAGRQAKPSQKLIESKKRSLSDDEDEAPLRGSTTGTTGNGPPPATKIKIKPIVKVGGGGGGGTRVKAGSKAGLTQLVLKPRGRPPVHPPGDGYDSEASDNEVDPAIEEQFVLRMMPGEHADYVRWCLENGKIGLPKSAGGADIYMRFFEEESRRGFIMVKGQCYAAVMVDLPTITESMKTWDRKSLMKSADICQMMLVFQAVKSEEEARHAPLPSIIDSSFKWPHGLTPPMHDCVNRRFAKTISRKEIEDKEAEVERLLAEDGKCASTKWEWVDERDGGPDEDGEEDAEGEMDDTLGYFGQQHMSMGLEEDNDFDLEADLEAAFADELMAETPATAMDTQTPSAALVGTPATAALQQSIEASESDEDDDDDDDDDDDEDLDEDARAQRDEEQGVKDIINDLKKQLAARVADFERTQNKILRTRLENQIKQLKSEIELKQSSIGIEADD